MENSVNFLNTPYVTAVGPGVGKPVAYNVDASLGFPFGVYEKNGVSITFIDEEKVVIQLNVNAVNGTGPSTLNFRDEFSQVCLQYLEIEIVVHDGSAELGKKGGTHQEDCEEVLKPITQFQNKEG